MTIIIIVHSIGMLPHNILRIRESEYGSDFIYWAKRLNYVVIFDHVLHWDLHLQTNISFATIYISR